MKTLKHLTLFLCLSLLPTIVYAQAWVPQARQGYFTLEYQFTDVGKHLFSGDRIIDGVNLGTSPDRGDIKAHSLALMFDYGMVRNFAVSGSLPFISSKYTGDYPENPGIDNGDYHGQFQDLSLAARYMFNIERLAVTPFFSTVIPTHDYETFGHVSVGRNVFELRPGIAFGRTLFPLISSAYFQASYAYTFTEEIDGIGTDRSNIDLSLGYIVTRSLGASLLGSWQIAHEGIDWLELDEGNIHSHDRLAKASWFRLFGTISYGLLENLTLSLSGGTTLWGENTHEATAIGVATSWGFGLY